MTSTLNLFENVSSSIPSEEFELFCVEVLRELAIRDGLKNFQIDHNQKIQAADGLYQIDIFSSFTCMDSLFKILVECKCYKRSVERKVVTDLHARMSSLGMHKAMVMSTSGYQAGAIEYARVHGISLVQVIDKQVLFITNSVGYQDPTLLKIKQAYQRKLPEYFALLVDSELGLPHEIIYPTSDMQEKTKKEILAMFHDEISAMKE